VKVYISEKYLKNITLLILGHQITAEQNSHIANSDTIEKSVCSSFCTPHTFFTCCLRNLEVGCPTYRQWSICRFPSRPNVMDPTSDQRLLHGSSVKLLYYIEIDLSSLQTSIPPESSSFNQRPFHTAAVHNTANKTPVFGDFIVQKLCVAYIGSLFQGYVRCLFHTPSAIN
jgi:hypothetical protein